MPRLSGRGHRRRPGSRSVRVYDIDPVRDPRWPAFLAGHASASVFHSAEWLEALRRTYGYKSVAYTTTPPGRPLENGIVFCRVQSWITGSRLVSLPFSDHCEPLAACADDWTFIAGRLRDELSSGALKYIELRPAPSSEGRGSVAPFSPSEQYWFHRLDLRPELRAIYGNFHRSCIQRKIQRAEREGLACEAGFSEALLAKFYQLLLLTRQRHGLPPQPIAWFRTLAGAFPDRLTIYVASKGDTPIASILALSYKKTLIYKYGCSDRRYHNLGGMPLLFWQAIRQGKQNGAEEFDLGRSDLDTPGLLNFKEHLGATGRKGSYYRLETAGRQDVSRGIKRRLAGSAFARMPSSLARAAGGLLYRHMG